MEDGRKFDRIGFSVPVQLSADGVEQDCDCLNVSMKGMLVRARDPLPFGTKGIIKLDQQSGDQSMHITASFEVIRAGDLDPVSRQFDHALMLIDIDSDSSVNLYKIIRQNLGD